MDWRKEDFRYAAATLAAAVFVAYLIAGNFGLVPSPLTGGPQAAGTGTLPDLGIDLTDQISPAVAVDADESAAALGAVFGTTATPPPPPPPPPPPAPAVDTQAPQSQFVTPDGTVEVSAGVTGRTTDDLSGVARVTVTYRLLGSDAASAQVEATLDCTDASRRVCTWRAEPTLPVGQYTVQAQGQDQAGNLESPGPTISLVLVATPIPGDTESDAGLVGTVTGTLGSVVGTLTGTVGRLLGGS